MMLAYLKVKGKILKNLFFKYTRCCVFHEQMKIKMAKEAETSECFKMSELKNFIYKNMTEVSLNYKNNCLFYFHM